MATKPKVTPITAAPSAGKPKPPGSVVAIKAGSNVVSIQEMLRAQAAAMSERTAPASGNYIRVTQDKQFVLPDGSRATELDVVIVDFTALNKFYESDYQKDAIVPPACFAIGTNPMRMTPSDNSPLKQAVSCQGCPMNEFGSAGKGKACKNSRVLAVLPPDADADTPIWLLATSPTANKGFDGYVGGIARVFQTPPVGVVTKISFNPAQSYAQLQFGEPSPNENVAVHFARQDEAREMLTVEPDVSSFVKEKPAPRGKVVARR